MGQDAKILTTGGQRTRRPGGLGVSEPRFGGEFTGPDLGVVNSLEVQVVETGTLSRYEVMPRLGSEMGDVLS